MGLRIYGSGLWFVSIGVNSIEPSVSATGNSGEVYCIVLLKLIIQGR